MNYTAAPVDRPPGRLWGIALAALLSLLLAPWQPQPSVANDQLVGRVTVPINKSQSVSLGYSYAEVLVGSSEIAHVLPLTDRSIYVLGQQPGTTSISILDSDRRVIGVFEVEVTLDIATIQQRIHEATGNRSIRVADNNGRLVLSGPVSDAPSVDRAMQIATQYAPGEVINAMNVTTTQQIMLKVRFIEATRRAGRDLGVRWDGRGGTSNIRLGRDPHPTGLPAGQRLLPLDVASTLAAGGTPVGVILANLVNDGFNIDVAIQALEERGHARSLAEPNLVALSGDTASFLAGGEFPYQVSRALDEAPTIQFKEFGVRLSFTPTVLKGGHINLVLEPEVSTLDFSQPTASGEPILSTRRARTTIELRDGQSFAIAGLLQTQSSRSISQLPWLGSIPVLGALFRSAGYQNQETDLVIIVTPHLVQPGAPGDRIATPLDRSLPANDPDLFLMGQMEIPKEYRHYVEAGVGIRGPYGHMLEPQFGYGGIVGKGR